MLGGGYFTPLDGYMTKTDALSVADTLTTQAGVFFPVPVMNLLESTDVVVGERIALLDPNVKGNPVIAIQTVSAVDQFTKQELLDIAQEVYGTISTEHPGVKAFLSQGCMALAGDIQVFNFSYFETDFAETFRTAVQIREEIAALGWQKIVAFQTRNPMHRAHEELCKMAMAATGAEGCVIHMLLGKLKDGDIPANVRDASIREMVANYFPANSVMVSGYGFDMLYAYASRSDFAVAPSFHVWVQLTSLSAVTTLVLATITVLSMHKLSSKKKFQKALWKSKYLMLTILHTLKF